MRNARDVFAVIILLFFILPFMCFSRSVIWRNAGTNPGIKTDFFYFSWGPGGGGNARAISICKFVIHKDLASHA